MDEGGFGQGRISRIRFLFIVAESNQPQQNLLVERER